MALAELVGMSSGKGLFFAPLPGTVLTCHPWHLLRHRPHGICPSLPVLSAAHFLREGGGGKGVDGMAGDWGGVEGEKER